MNNRNAVMNHRFAHAVADATVDAAAHPLPSRRGVLAGLSTVLALPALTLAGCGFELRKAPVFAFQSIALKGRGRIVALVRRGLQAAGTVQVVDVDPDPKAAPPEADAVLEAASELRSRLVLSTNAAGAVKANNFGSTPKET